MKVLIKTSIERAEALAALQAARAECARERARADVAEAQLAKCRTRLVAEKAALEQAQRAAAAAGLPANALADAVREELRAATARELTIADPNRLSWEALRGFSVAEWLSHWRATRPLLTAVLERALIGPPGVAAAGANERTTAARLRSMATALACCSRAVIQEWLRQFALMQSICVYTRSNSADCVRYLNVLGYESSGRKTTRAGTPSLSARTHPVPPRTTTTTRMMTRTGLQGPPPWWALA
jgi:hypothetical protein